MRNFRGEEAEQRRIGATAPVPSSLGSAKPKPAVPKLLLAETWTPDADVSGWWLSEKLDGVRAYLNAWIQYLRCHTVPPG